MNRTLKLLAALALAFGSTLELWSQGYIVPNGVVYAGYGGLGYEFHVIHDPANGAYTGFFLRPEGVTPPSSYVNTFQFSPYVDISVRVFLVSPNDPISLQPIMAGTYSELAVANYVFNSGAPFYLGLYTGNMQYAPTNGIYTDPLYGWVELVNNGGTIQMLDSAIEYQGGGILAGTETILAVPEPSAMVLCALGALLFAGWRRGVQARRSASPIPQSFRAVRSA